MHKKRKPFCSPVAWVRLSSTVSLQSLDDTFMLLDYATQKRMCLMILTESVAVLFKDLSENIKHKTFLVEASLMFKIFSRPLFCI